MKKDLDQLLAEYRQKEAQVTSRGDNVASPRNDLLQEMTWSERGKLLIEMIEQHNGAISQKELLYDQIEKLGITNSEEGRSYLRNFLSLFVQQKVLLKQTLKNKTHFTLNRQYSSTNIQEYFYLLSAPTMQNESYHEIAHQKYLKRVELLVDILLHQGAIPVSKLVDEHIVELGFTNDIKGRHEVADFLKRTLREGTVAITKKDSVTFINVSGMDQAKSAKPASQTVHRKRPPQPAQTGSRREEKPPLAPSAADRTASIRQIMDREIFLSQVLYELEQQINGLDDQFIEISAQKNRAKDQLLGLEKLMNELMAPKGRPHRENVNRT